MVVSEEAAPARRRAWEWVVLGLCAAFLAYWQSRYVGYIKDDAFISMRYARNLAEGQGLVFNPGDRLEGYTNFLWVILLTPAFWLGVDPVTWAKALGCLAGQAGVWLSHAVARQLGGDRPSVAALLAPIFWVTSPSVVLWSMGGLEPTWMACLCGGSVYIVMRIVDRPDGAPIAPRLGISLAALLSLAILLRPDSHAIVLVALAGAALDRLRRRRLDQLWVTTFLAVLAVALPYHLFRRFYFGDWLPNTFYVKAAAGPEVWKAGGKYVLELITFGANPAIFGLAGLSLFLPGRRWASRLIAAAAVGGFLLYLVKIGRDEMKWFRLYLPVYPLAIGLAADALARLVDRLPGGPRVRATLAAGLVVLGAGGAWTASRAMTAGKADWHNHYLRWSQNSFGAMGRYVGEHSKPGEKVVFQDMGGAPFAGGDQIWLDTIGILNRFVAQELAAVGLNPFMRGEKSTTKGGAKAVVQVDKRIRDPMLGQDPRWIAFVAYVQSNQ